MSEGNFDFEQAIKDAHLGQVNIVVAGKTGIGKSTLINAIFGEDLAETGAGSPCTQKTIHEYQKENSFLHLFDTKGIESETTQSMLTDLTDCINEHKGTNPNKHIHIAWYCIRNGRYENFEIEFIKSLSKQIPVIVVVTQAPKKNCETLANLKKEPGIINVLAVKAIDDEDFDPNEEKSKIHGLKELTEKTYNLLPDAAKKAFAAAQKVNYELRKASIEKIIAVAAAAATAAGAAPIPFSDAAVLAPIQIGMIAKICQTMGLSLDRAFLTTLIGGAAGIGGTTYAGRAIVSGLLKCIPGVGSIVGGAISATTAGALTVTMGWAFYKALASLLDKNIEITPDTLSGAFKEEMKKSKND